MIAMGRRRFVGQLTLDFGDGAIVGGGAGNGGARNVGARNGGGVINDELRPKPICAHKIEPHEGAGDGEEVWEKKKRQAATRAHERNMVVREQRGNGKRGRPIGKAVGTASCYRVVRDALEVEEGGFREGAMLTIEEVFLMMKLKTITPGTVFEHSQTNKKFVVKDCNGILRREVLE